LAGSSAEDGSLNYGYWDLAITYSGSFTWRNKNSAGTEVVNQHALYIYTGKIDNEDNAERVPGAIAKIYWAKLEKGPTATPWCPA
jgi:hypothetical protein